MEGTIREVQGHVSGLHRALVDLREGDRSHRGQYNGEEWQMRIHPINIQKELSAHLHHR